MMSTPSWVSRVSRQSVAVHLEENQELKEAMGPSPSAATATFHDTRTTQHSQTVKPILSPNIIGTLGSTAASVPSPSSSSSATALGVVSPRSTATLTSLLARTPGCSPTTPTTATLPIIAPTTSAHPGDVTLASAAATLPAFAPIVDNFAGAWPPLLSPASGLSSETDTSKTSSCKQQKTAAAAAAAHVLLPPARPTVVPAVTSAAATPPLPYLNADTKWQETWRSNPMKLSPAAFGRVMEGNNRKEGEHHSLVVERINVAAEKASSVEKLTTAASTPALTATMPIGTPATSAVLIGELERPSSAAALTETMPAASPVTPSALEKEPAAPRGGTKCKKSAKVSAVGAVVSSTKTLPGEPGLLPSSAMPITGDPVIRPRIPTRAAEAVTRASRGEKPPLLTARSSPTASQELAAYQKVIENEKVLLQLSPQLSSHTCQSASTCLFIETPQRHGLPPEGTSNISSTCGVERGSSQESGNAGCLTLSSRNEANTAHSKPAFNLGATPTSSETKKKALYQETTTLPPGALAELAALCAVDSATAEGTSDSFEAAAYMDAFVASLPQPGSSPANSSSTFSPAFCPYPSFAGYAASPSYVEDSAQPFYGALSGGGFDLNRGSKGNGSSSNTEDSICCTATTTNNSTTPVNPTSTNNLSNSSGRYSNSIGCGSSSKGTGTNTLESISSSCTNTNYKNNGGGNTINNNSAECNSSSSSASFLPSLLPLLSHIKALSVSVSGSPRNTFHDDSAAAAAVKLPPPQTSCIPPNREGGEASINIAIFESSENVGMQRQAGNVGTSPKRTSPYLPFFSFNSISSAFQSPAVSHLSRKSFCTIPLSPVDSARAFNARSTAVAALSLDPSLEVAAAPLQNTRPATGNLLSAENHEWRQEGSAAACTKAPKDGIISKKGKAAGPEYTEVVSSAGGEAKAFKQPAATTMRTQTPWTGARPLSAEGQADPTSHHKPQKLSVACGAGVSDVAATAAAAGTALSSSCAAKPMAGVSSRSGTLLYGAEQKPLPTGYMSSKISSNSSAIGSSRNNYSSVTSGMEGGSTRNNKTMSSCVSLQGRRNPEDHDVDPERLSTTLQQQGGWSGCFASDTAHSHMAEEAATALSAGDCASFAVDEMYCMQTPSRTRFSSVRISPLLSQVYAASDNGVLCVWNMTGCCQRPLIINSYHSKAITELDISPDGQLLASASLDGTLRLKHTATATHVVHPSCTSATDLHHNIRPSSSSSLFSSRGLPAAHHPHSTSVPAVMHHQNGAYQVNASSASQMFDSYYHLPAVPPPSGNTLSAGQMWCTTGLHRTKLSATSSHAASIPPCPPYCYTQPSCVGRSSHTCNIPSSGRLLLPVSAPRPGDHHHLPSPPLPTNMRRSTSGEQQMQEHSVRGHSNAVVSLHFSSDGAFLLSASRDKSVKLWKNPSLDFVAAFTGHTNWVCCARFAPISAAAPVTFASCAEDRTVRVWNAERKEPVLLFRLCEGFHSTSAATTLRGALGNSSCHDTTGSSRSGVLYGGGGGGLGATGGGSSTSASSKFGPCLKSCRFVFGGASVLAGGSSDGTVTLWDVRQEPKAPSQFYNASWLQSAPLYRTTSHPGSRGSYYSSANGNPSQNSSVICDTDRKGAIKKAGISYLDATVDGTSLLALSTSGVAHLIDLRYNKPLFSIGHTKTSVLTQNNTVLASRGKKACSTHFNRQGSLHGSRSPHIDNVSTQPFGTAANWQNTSGTVSTEKSGGTTADIAVDTEAAAAFSRYQQQQRQKRTAAVITAASFGPVLQKYERLPHLQQQQQVLSTADAEGRVVVWRWDLASPQMLYMQEYEAAAAAAAEAEAAASFCEDEKTSHPFAAVCPSYSSDTFGSFAHKTAEECMHAYAFAEEETRATVVDCMGGTPCMQTAENYGYLDAAGERP